MIKAKNTQQKKSAQQLIGISAIEDNCILVTSGERLAFILMTPVNLNVLSSVTIRSRINKLADTIKTLGSVDFLCINSSQSYDSNKRYLTDLKEREQNDTLRELDEKDIEFFDNIRVSMATSREFLAILRFRPKDTPDHVRDISRKARDIMKDNGMSVRQAISTDTKRLLAIYLEQNIFEAEMQDFDGERYSNILEMNV